MPPVFSSPNAHLATTGPAGSASTLEAPPRAQRAEPPQVDPPRAASATGAEQGPRWRDPFRHQRARHGHGAGFRWWHRLGAAAALVALIGALGVLLAALVGFAAFVGGVALETLIG